MNLEHGLYRVCGTRAYRGHAPGTEFSALLDRGAEARAVRRGDIELVQRVEPSLVAGSYVLPRGWTKIPRRPRNAGSYSTLERGGLVE